MALKDDISLLHIPSVQKDNKSYSVIPSDGTGDLICSRNGSATYFDKDGIIRTAAPNEPRLEFNPDGTFKGALAEEAATNLLLRSLYFESSNWLIQGSRISRTFNSDIAPDGTFTATKFTRVIDGAYLLRQTLPSSTFTLGSTWTYSVWVKAINQNITVNLDISDRGNASFSVTPQEGWKRISATHTWNDTNFNTVGHFFDISVMDLSLNNSHLLWGAQLEVGLLATSYIPTTSASVTRPADIITLPNYSTLFGERNSRLVTTNGDNKIYINESNLQLPVGHNKLLLEKQGFFTEQEQTDLSATTATYGVREDIKDELNQVLALNPSLVMIPGKGSAGGLQTLVPNDGTGDFTVSRNGTATYLGSDGLLKTAQANEPRLEFNPDGTFKGVLVEPAATNLLLRSEEFDNGYWVKTRCTILINQEISPNGSLTADYLIQDNTTGLSYVGRIGVGTTIGQTWTFSFYCKKKDRSVIGIQVNEGGVNFPTARFNFDTKTFIQSTGFSSFSFQEIPNGWFRLIFTRTPTAGTTSTFGIYPTDVNGNLSGVGDGVSRTIIWGAQLETGSVATSYIPTVASTVTRPADVITRTNAQDLIGQTEGTIYIEIDYLRRVSTFGVSYVMLINQDGIFQNRIQFGIDQAHRIITILTNSSVSQNVLVSSSNVQNVKNKLILVYTQNLAKIFLNGVLVQTTSLTVFPQQLMNIVKIGNNFANVTPSYNDLKTAFILKSALTDEQAIALTTL